MTILTATPTVPQQRTKAPRTGCPTWCVEDHAQQRRDGLGVTHTSKTIDTPVGGACVSKNANEAPTITVDVRPSGLDFTALPLRDAATLAAALQQLTALGGTR